MNMAMETARPVGRVDLFKAWPILVVIASVIATAAVDNFRIEAQAADVSENTQAISANQAAIQQLVRSVDRTNASLELEITRLKSQIALADSKQGQQLEAILAALLALQQSRN
jgi:hypothetical protein